MFKFINISVQIEIKIKNNPVAPTVKAARYVIFVS